MAKQAQIDAVRPILTEADKAVTAVEHALDAVEVGADKAAAVVESGLETVADVVPEALDKSVHVTAEVAKKGVRAFRNPKVLAISIALAGAAAGVALGITAYKLQRKRLEKEFETELERQLDEMRQYYMLRNKEGAFLTPRSAAEALQVEEAVEALKTYSGEGDEPALPAKEAVQRGKDVDAATKAPAGQTRYDQIQTITDKEAVDAIRQSAVTVSETIEHNVFVDGRRLDADLGDWNQEAEEAHRQPEVPYVISHDEYMENAFEHPQRTLTWYEADQTLADSDESLIDDIEAVVGVANMSLFGHGSRDSKVVYIRNERTEEDYEVTRSAGSFAEEVMGLQHSDETRFRGRRGVRE